MPCLRNASNTISFNNKQNYSKMVQMTELSRSLREALEALARAAEIARDGVDKESNYAIYLERIMFAWR